MKRNDSKFCFFCIIPSVHYILCIYIIETFYPEILHLYLKKKKSLKQETKSNRGMMPPSSSSLPSLRMHASSIIKKMEEKINKSKSENEIGLKKSNIILLWWTKVMSENISIPSYITVK